MAEKTLKVRLVQKNDTEANWNKATNFIPKKGEIILYSPDNDHNYYRIKVGDGTTKVTALGFLIEYVVDRNLADTVSSLESLIAAKYTKPSTGIPKSDLASAVQTSLGKADSALQNTLPATEVKGGAIDVHPENSGTIISYYTNDLAYLTQRGGSFVMTNTTTGSTIASYGSGSSGAGAHNMFDGSPSYYNGWTLAATTNVITILIKSPTAYSYSTQCGIGFGAANWRAKDVKIEFGYSATNKGTAQSPDSDIAWVTKINITNQSNGLVFGAGGGPNASQGGVAASTWQYLRLTLTNWNGTSPRIAQIFTINYGSRGLHNTFLPLSGGRVYGTINANALQVSGKNVLTSGNSTSTTKTGISAALAATPTFTGTAHHHTYSKAKFNFNTSTRDLTLGFDTTNSGDTTATGSVSKPNVTITDNGHTHTLN